MKAQHQHHQPVSRAILNSVNPESFVPRHLTTRALNDDSCWEECESDFDETLPMYVLDKFDDVDF